jgi:hypothetical protein
MVAVIAARTKTRCCPHSLKIPPGRLLLPGGLGGAQSQALVFTPEDSGTKKTPITYAAFPGEEPAISGGIRLRLTWTPYRDGIVMARVPAGLRTDQLFVNGKREILALPQLRSGGGVLQWLVT